MSTVPTTEKRAVQLHFDSGRVVVTPADQDRFVMEAKLAIASCQGFMAFDRFWNQFQDEFLARVNSWCREQSAKVSSCFVLYPTGPDVRVFVIGSSPEFDFDLNDCISDLELEFGEQGWQADIVQLPSASPETFGSYFEASQSIQVYGNSGGTSSEGRA